MIVTGEPLPEALAPPGLATMVYPVIGTPPVNPGATKVIDAWPLPAVAVPIVGAAGTTAETLKEWVTEPAGR